MALEGSAKEGATLALAGFLASAAANAGTPHAAWMLGEALRPIGNGTRAPSSWEDIDFVHRGGPAGAFTHAAPGWRRAACACCSAICCGRAIR